MFTTIHQGGSAMAGPLVTIALPIPSIAVAGFEVTWPDQTTRIMYASRECAFNGSANAMVPAATINPVTFDLPGTLARQITCPGCDLPWGECDYLASVGIRPPGTPPPPRV